VSDFVQNLAVVIPSDIRKSVERELRLGWNMSTVKAKAQAKQEAIYRNNKEAKPIEGIGQLVASIPEDAFHYWGIRLGYECWEDKQFMKEFIRDNPEVAVRNRMKRTMVGGAKGLFDASGFLIK
jgi:hypothetical protein